jgi:hypothetical protein
MADLRQQLGGPSLTPVAARRSPQAHLDPRRAPSHICRAAEALGGRAESQGCSGGDAGACEGRQEEAPPSGGGPVGRTGKIPRDTPSTESILIVA